MIDKIWENVDKVGILFIFCVVLLWMLIYYGKFSFVNGSSKKGNGKAKEAEKELIVRGVTLDELQNHCHMVSMPIKKGIGEMFKSIDDVKIIQSKQATDIALINQGQEFMKATLEKIEQNTNGKS